MFSWLHCLISPYKDEALVGVNSLTSSLKVNLVSSIDLVNQLPEVKLPTIVLFSKSMGSTYGKGIKARNGHVTAGCTRREFTVVWKALHVFFARRCKSTRRDSRKIVPLDVSINVKQKTAFHNDLVANPRAHPP